MTNARDIESVLFIRTGKFNCIITRVKAEIIKHNEVINSMDSQFGIILLKRSMLNIQPARSRKLIKNTIMSNIQIVLLKVRIVLINLQPCFGPFSFELPDIGSLMYFKNS
jgi:hypothetical protein